MNMQNNQQQLVIVGHSNASLNQLGYVAHIAYWNDFTPGPVVPGNQYADGYWVTNGGNNTWTVWDAVYLFSNYYALIWIKYTQTYTAQIGISFCDMTVGNTGGIHGLTNVYNYFTHPGCFRCYRKPGTTNVVILVGAYGGQNGTGYYDTWVVEATEIGGNWTFSDTWFISNTHTSHDFAYDGGLFIGSCAIGVSEDGLYWRANLAHGGSGVTEEGAVASIGDLGTLGIGPSVPSGSTTIKLKSENTTFNTDVVMLNPDPSQVDLLFAEYTGGTGGPTSGASPTSPLTYDRTQFI